MKYQKRHQLIFSFELMHKRGAKLHPYSDIIALLIFMFPKMNNFCCSATEIEDMIHRNIVIVAGRPPRGHASIDILSSNRKLSLEIHEKHKITTKSGKQIDGIRDAGDP